MHQSSFKLPGALLLLSLLCSTDTIAVGRYTESFTSLNPSGWTSDGVETWSSGTGDYRNMQGLSGSTVAWYSGRQWTTNYTYKVRAYSDWPGTGNDLGVVFGLSDATHYFEVLLSVTDGAVDVKQVSGNPNSPNTLASGTATGLAVDTWFDLEVFVDGDNVVVKVNDQVVINAPGVLPTLDPGNIGFVAR